MNDTDSGGDRVAVSKHESLFSVAAEEAWLKLSTDHFTAKEWEASRQAAQISDRIRWYRLHREAIESGRANVR